MRADPVPQILSSCEPRRRCNCYAQHRHEYRSGVDLTAFGVAGLESWPRRNPRTSSRLLDAPGAAPGRASLTTAGRGRRSEAVAIAVGVALAFFLPNQLQRQVSVRLQLFVDLRPLRLGMFSPNGVGLAFAETAFARSAGRSSSPAQATSRRPLARSTSTHGRCSARWSNCGRSGAGSVRGNGAAECFFFNLRIVSFFR